MEEKLRSTVRHHVNEFVHENTQDLFSVLKSKRIYFANYTEKKHLFYKFLIHKHRTEAGSVERFVVSTEISYKYVRLPWGRMKVIEVNENETPERC